MKQKAGERAASSPPEVYIRWQPRAANGTGHWIERVRGQLNHRPICHDRLAILVALQAGRTRSTQSSWRCAWLACTAAARPYTLKLPCCHTCVCCS